MAAKDAFAAYCVELLAPLGAARSRRMFGGHGLYIDDLFVAVVAAERLYLKVDAETRPLFEAAGCAPFVYDTKSGSMAMSYWSAPEAALESPAQMQPWARRSIEAALRARASKATPARRKPSAAASATAARRRKSEPSRSRPKRSTRGT
jgi:DNA transformation protein